VRNPAKTDPLRGCVVSMSAFTESELLCKLTALETGKIINESVFTAVAKETDKLVTNRAKFEKVISG
jgi:hypothetical protein